MSDLMLGEALRRIGGPLNDLISKLLGPDWEAWLTALKRFLRKENPWPVAGVFHTWKTIQLGTHKTVGVLKRALGRLSFDITNNASYIMSTDYFTLATRERSIELLLATVKELGFSGPTCYVLICRRIRELGCELCPAEVGPQLRRQYHDQPKNEQLVIAMETITDLDSRPLVFVINHDESGQRLGVCYAYPDTVFTLAKQIVFARRTAA